MRVSLKELLEKLGVNRELSPYETQPWLHYDEDKGITCSAEVRMGPGHEDLEAEIQFVYEERDEDDSEKGEGDTGGGDTQDEERPSSGHKQIMRLRALPVNEDQWSPKAFLFKGEDYTTKLGGWEEKACSFFQACIQAILMGELPDIEELSTKELEDDSSSSGRWSGRVGRKSPKVKPGALMGMKK